MTSTFIQNTVAIRVTQAYTDPVTIGALLTNSDKSLTLLLNQPMSFPEILKIRQNAQSLDLEAMTHLSLQRDDEFVTNYLQLIASEIPAGSSQASLEALLKQLWNRIKLLREGLMIARDWKTRLIMQYELDIVTRHQNILEEQLSRHDFKSMKSRCIPQHLSI